MKILTALSQRLRLAAYFDTHKDTKTSTKQFSKSSATQESRPLPHDYYALDEYQLLKS